MYIDVPHPLGSIVKETRTNEDFSFASRVKNKTKIRIREGSITSCHTQLFMSAVMNSENSLMGTGYGNGSVR